MHDDGRNGDAQAGDDIYTVQIAGDIQTHRRLVRYQIAVADLLGSQITVPYADDPQSNFAYFVYDGVPAWRGAVQPGVTPVIDFSAETMRSLPVYHLISRKSDVENCVWLQKYTRDQAGRKDFTLVRDRRLRRRGLRPRPLPRPRRHLAARDGQDHAQSRFRPGALFPGVR